MKAVEFFYLFICPLCDRREDCPKDVLWVTCSGCGIAWRRQVLIKQFVLEEPHRVGAHFYRLNVWEPWLPWSPRRVMSALWQTGQVWPGDYYFSTLN